MRRQAFGALGLTHAEFGRITPRELSERLDGYAWRQDRLREHLAWLAAHLMNASGNLKNEVTPGQLLGRRRDGTPLQSTAEVERDAREVIALLEG